MKRRYFLAGLAALAAAGCKRLALGATRYYATVYGACVDRQGRGVAGVTVTIEGKSSTTSSAGGDWLVTPAETVGQTYPVAVSAPSGWRLVSWSQSFVATEPPDPITLGPIVLEPLVAPAPTATASPQETLVEPTVDQTIIPNEVKWALLSWFGQWGQVGTAARQFLAVPREAWHDLRLAADAAQGQPREPYEMAVASKLGYALSQAEAGARLTPIVAVGPWLVIGMAAGILVVEA